MNEIQSKTPDSPETSEIQNRCASLDRRLSFLLLAVFVISGTLTVFIGIQSRRLGKDLAASLPQATEIMNKAKGEMPVINAFMSKLTEYGRTHPEFSPIIAKYRLGTNAPAAGAPPAAGSAAGAAPAAPKK